MKIHAGVLAVVGALIGGVLFYLVLKTIVEIYYLDWACMFLYLAFLLPFDGLYQSVPDSAKPTKS